MSQAITTTPGVNYILNFWQGNYSYNQTTTQRMGVTVKDGSGNIIIGPVSNGVTANSGTSGPAVWQNFTVTFTATTSTTTIQFADDATNPTNSTDLLLDDVSVAANSVGADNPTGITSGFPYTANASRLVIDLTVAGSVGVYPLQWSRVMNSRLDSRVDLPLPLFGAGGGWNHSYAWFVTPNPQTTSVRQTPASYDVAYPDGRVIHFVPSTKGDTGFYMGPPGIGDRLQPAIGTGDCFVIFRDGGKLQFHQTAVTDPNTGWYDYSTTPTALIDPNGLTTTITSDANGNVTKITDASLRWLKVSYSSGLISQVDAGYTISGADTISQSVTYTYGTHTYGNSYTVLDSVNYITDPNSPSATYTYQPSNVSPFNGTPLIATCNDIHAGQMKKIKYEFVQNGVYGQLYREDYIDGTPVVTLTVNGNTRTITRGDGSHPTQTWTYGTTSQSGFSVPQPYLLGDVTDFLTVHTYFSYDTNSYLNKIKDGKGNVTSFTRIPFTGNISVVTHPVDASTKQYFYTDPTTGYYTDHITDELQHTTNTGRDPTSHRLTKITYPDGTFELYGPYNGYGEPLSYQNTSGGVYQYTYDPNGRGMLVSVQDPYTKVTNYNYDLNDHLGSFQDARLNLTTTTYDARGRLVTLQHPAPNPSTINWVYNADDTLQSVTDELNHITTYNYDDYKRLTSVTTPQRGNGDTTTPTTYFWYQSYGSAVTDYTHTDSNVTRLVMPSGKVVVSGYDSNFRKISVTQAPDTGDVAFTYYGYDLVGNLQTVTDAKLNVWTYNYDGRNRLTSIDDPLSIDRNSNGHTINWTYDVANNVLTTTRANNQIISNDIFDPMNRVLQSTIQQAPSPDAVTKYTYYGPTDPLPSGLLKTFQDAKLVALNSADAYTYVYDKMGRLTSKQYPLDTFGVHRTEGYIYNSVSNVDTFTNRAGNQLKFTYNERNQPTLQHWDDNVTPDVNIGYDTASRVTSINNANANISRAYYNDNLSYTETVTPFPSSSPVPAAHTVTYTYDVDSNRSSIAYPGSGPVFSYAYTNRNQLDNISNGSPQWVKYIYDTAGNRQHRKLNNGVTDTVYGVADALNRIPSVSTTFTNGAASFNYDFDVVNRLKYEQRNGGTADGYAYDLANQITGFNREGTLSGGTVTNPVEAMSLNFDANGNRTSTNDNGTVANYVTDPLNQYTSDLNGATTYNANGCLLTESISGGGGGSNLVSDPGFENGANISPWTATGNCAPSNSSGAPHSGIYYFNFNGGQATPNGVLTQSVTTTPGTSYTLTFWHGINVYGQTATQKINVTIGTLAPQQFSLQATGSPSTISWKQETITFTAASGTTTLTFADDPTNPTINTDLLLDDVSLTANGSSGSSTYAYDAQNRLTNVSSTSDGSHGRYYYDGLNRQVARDENSVRTYSVWDGWNLIEEYDTLGNLNYYLHGVGELVARFQANNANRIWYYQDGRGNTSHIANDSGAMIERYTYDLGGKPLFFNGSGGSIAGSAYSNRFLYNGRDYSSLTKLYDFSNRFYRPDVSRFLQPDPIGFLGGSNLYRFVGNSPVNQIDPSGTVGFEAFKKIKTGDLLDGMWPIYGGIEGGAGGPWVTTSSGNSPAGGFGGGDSPGGNGLNGIAPNPFAGPSNGWNNMNTVPLWIMHPGFLTPRELLYPSALSVATERYYVNTLMSVGGLLAGPAIDLAGAVGAEVEGWLVYQSVSEAEVQYVGITSDFAARATAQLAGNNTTGVSLEITRIAGLSNLSLGDAAAVEQTLIDTYGLGKNGGTLLNQINSISPTSDPEFYIDSIFRGQELLEKAGYVLPGR